MTYHPEVANILFPIMIIVSIVMVSIGLWLRNKTRRFLLIAKQTTGKTVGSKERTTIQGKISFNEFTKYSLISFVTETGEEVVYESMVGAPWEKLKKNIPMLYNPENPKEARINSFLELKLPWITFLLIGVLMHIIVLVVGFLKYTGYFATI